MGFSCDNRNTGSCAIDGYPGYDGFLMMFAIACSTFVGAAAPGGVAAWKRTLQLMASTTRLATALLSELKVASVVVSVPFGGELMTPPSATVNGLAKLAAIGSALSMPTGFPAIFRFSMNCA